jgi:hypothetical protein
VVPRILTAPVSLFAIGRGGWLAESIVRETKVLTIENTSQKG